MDIVDLQDDLYLGLLSWDLVGNINIVQQRKFRLDSMTAFATIYTTPRNNKSGIGILVEMPTFEMSTNYSGPGPQTVLFVSLLVIECPPINLNVDTGTGTDAEAVAELLLPLLHQWLIDGEGEMYPQQRPIQPANDLPPGCLGYRVQVMMQHSPLFLPRVGLPVQTIDGSYNVTLVNQMGSPNATIYYTLDGSMPCSANTSAVQYTVPFVVTPGQTLRWAGWLNGYTPSTVGQAVIGA